MRRIVPATLLAASMMPLALGCGEPAEAGKQGAERRGPPPARVQVAAVERGTLTASRTFLGHVRPLSTTTLAAAVAGVVAEVKVRPGDAVAEGDVLATLDTDLVRPRLAAARAAERQAAAELRQARREKARADALPHPVVTDAERERFASRVEALEAGTRARAAEVARLKAELDRHTVTAPFAGTVRARAIEPGMWVNPGQAMLGLVSTGDLEVQVDVDPSLLSHVEPGSAANLLGDPPIEATVAGVVPALDEATRTVHVRLTPTTRAEWMLAGAPVEVRFEWRTAPGLRITRDALVRGPSGVRVVAAVDGKAAPRPVKIVATADTEAIIAGDGITEGLELITRGNERVRPGQPLMVVQPGAGGPPDKGRAPGEGGPPKPAQKTN